MSKNDRRFLQIECVERDGRVATEADYNLSPIEAFGAVDTAIKVALEVASECPCPHCAERVMALKVAEPALAEHYARSAGLAGREVAGHA